MTSLDEFAAHQRPTAGATDRWFDEHSGVLDEVVEGFQNGIPKGVIWRWLREKHAYPLSLTSIHALHDRLTR